MSEAGMTEASDNRQIKHENECMCAQQEERDLRARIHFPLLDLSAISRLSRCSLPPNASFPPYRLHLFVDWPVNRYQKLSEVIESNQDATISENDYITYRLHNKTKILSRNNVIN
ncbi:hypothetical protein HZU73_00459 [Apis mellifera caucasica]|uniref:Uncharacterized protein LOC102653873 n=1 Tax=Apis mellifera TaxID=7460 RepID=A0A7M7L1R8_APIME|nr:uncharacterized protein LOC102653873 [Apis mellifera]KAG6804156.1 hypothetical protein HZU73_00459 [Apis mellifera caucasica]KAG9433686.1 hypothetical protein HZU67_04237 [Apis mellifera carnica]|eukprot:XP_026296441.1 uncharacterized protein LOC102653873 [Apis mellifera]